MSNKRGSVTIESSIAFTVVLVFLASMISIINIYRTDILMRRAQEQTCEKVSMICPLAITASDVISTTVNAFPDIEIDGISGSDAISQVAKFITGADMASGYTIEEMVLEGALGGYMANDIAEGYISRNGGSDFMLPDDINVTFEVNTQKSIIEVCTTYSVLTLAGRCERSIYNVIPIYGKGDLFLLASDEQKKESDIWSEDNFTRGDYFREQYGGNLPKTFPVIDAYDNGKATSIMSIDLTAPTYGSDDEIIKKICGNIDDLAGFGGADTKIDGTQYTIDSVTDKSLIVVIPSNADESAKNTVYSMGYYAASKGITMTVEEYGTSMKYAE